MSVDIKLKRVKNIMYIISIIIYIIIYDNNNIYDNNIYDNNNM